MVSTVEPKAQKTVKAYEDDIAFINEQAKAMGCGAAELIHLMCNKLRKEVYLQELAETFASLKGDAEFEAEEKIWDGVIADGLD